MKSHFGILVVAHLGDSLAPIPAQRFTRLTRSGFPSHQLEVLGYVCAFTGIDPAKVTTSFAETLLVLTYNLPHKHRKSKGHIGFVLLLAHEVTSMLRRYEIDRVFQQDPEFADVMARIVDEMSKELETLRCLLKRGTK